jgi:hypothetical protein
LPSSKNATTDTITPYTIGENLFFDRTTGKKDIFSDPDSCAGRFLLVIFVLNVNNKLRNLEKNQGYGKMAVEAWANEKIHYNWEKCSSSSADNNSFSDVNNFTALVWATTTDVGCGISVISAAVSDKPNPGLEEPVITNVYVVCNFYKPGNVLKKYSSNVFKGCRNGKPIINMSSIC